MLFFFYSDSQDPRIRKTDARSRNDRSSLESWECGTILSLTRFLSFGCPRLGVLLRTQRGNQSSLFFSFHWFSYSRERTFHRRENHLKTLPTSRQTLLGYLNILGKHLETNGNEIHPSIPRQRLKRPDQVLSMCVNQ